MSKSAGGTLRELLVFTTGFHKISLEHQRQLGQSVEGQESGERAGSNDVLEAGSTDSSLPRLSDKKYTLKMVQRDTKVLDLKRRLIKEAGLGFTVPLTPEQLVLSYYGDVMADGDSLADYGVDVGVFDDARIEVCAVSATPMRENSQKAAAEVWEPLKREARIWTPSSLAPNPKSYIRWAASREGCRGVLQVMRKFPNHARNLEECMWCLILLASFSQNGIAFRDHLREKHLYGDIVSAMERFPDHFGLQKQALGLLHYILGGTAASLPGHRGDTFPEMMFKAVDANIAASCIKSMIDAIDRLAKVELIENELAAANTYADIIMFNAEILCIIITGLQELGGEGASRLSRTEGIFQTRNVTEIMVQSIPLLHGTFFETEVRTSMEACIEVAWDCFGRK